MTNLDAYDASATPEPQPGVTITRLIPASIKEVWPTEPGSFTPWLLENASQLSEVLGVEIELDAREYKVGSFSLDLIGRVAGGEIQDVIVENQYGDTDHRHLGQILTYAGGTNPSIIIWIAESFREEHRAALDWLNQSTHPNVRFFGVRLGAVRMEGADTMLVAPRLELVSKPNDWEKLAKLEVAAAATGADLSPASKLYKQFWERFATEAYARGWTTATPPIYNWWDLKSGTTNVTWGVSYAQFGCRSELHFSHPDPQVNLYRLSLLAEKADEIQAAFGTEELIFDTLPNKKATRVDCRRHGPSIDDEAAWDDNVAWMVDTQDRLRAAIASVGGIPTALPPD